MPGRILAAATLVLSLSLSVASVLAAPPQKVESGAEACQAAKVAFRSHGARYSSSAASSTLDATYYHLNLNIAMDDDTIVGVVRVERRVTGSALPTLTLDLAPSMQATDVNLRMPTDELVEWTHTGAVLAITMPVSQPVGTLVAVDIAYHGVPVSDGFGNFFF